MNEVFYVPLQQHREKMDTDQESAQNVKSREENLPATPAEIQIHNLSIMSPALYQLSYPPFKLPSG